MTRSATPYAAGDRVALKFLASSALGLLLVVAAGLVLAAELAWRTPVTGLSFLALRPLHIQTVIFPWLSMALMGGILYAVPRAMGRALYSPRLAEVQFWLMWAGIALVALSFAAGYSTGREYVEIILPLDFAVVAVWALFALNVFATILASPPAQAPLAVWFMAMAVVYLGVNYLVKMLPFQGIRDPLAIWTFAHNQVNGWFMVGLMGLMYFLLPLLTGVEERPPYPPVLTTVHFWTLMVFVPPSVLHHLLYDQAPVSPFWKEVGQWTSVAMPVPTGIWLYVFYRYLRARRTAFSLPLQFFTAAMVFYGLNCLQGASQSLRFVNTYTHATQWTIGHAHLALLGWISFGVFGVIYALLPELAAGRAWRAGLARVHLWAAIVGFAGMFVVLSWGGLVQAAMVAAGSSFTEIKAALGPFITARLAFGAIFVMGSIAFAWNVWRLVAGRPLPELAAQKA